MASLERDTEQMSDSSWRLPIVGLGISFLALAGFWMIVYDASALIAAILLLEAGAIIALAFGVAARSQG